MRLTNLARGGGCGCKLGRSALIEALALVPQAPDPDVLAGFDRAEDAAVYRVRDDLAIVASVDFFTPIVDDPATFGAIAATNALSDLHAMGASPILALAVAAYPDDADPRDLAVLMRAGAEAALAEGCPVLGGHTIADPEPKYGLAVVGTVHPDRILSNAAGTPGDLLILTKPLGTGVIVTAQKAGRGDPAAMEAAVATISPGVPLEVEDLLHDPQTSGGLLLAVAPGEAGGLRRELAGRGVRHWEIGRLSDGPAGRIAVTA